MSGTWWPGDEETVRLPAPEQARNAATPGNTPPPPAAAAPQSPAARRSAPHGTRPDLAPTEIIPALRTHPPVLRRASKTLPLKRKWRPLRTISVSLSAVMAAALLTTVTWAAVSNGPSVISPGQLLARHLAPSNPSPVPTYPGLHLSPRLGSPQGCIKTKAPTPTGSNILYTARGRLGVEHEVALTFDDGPSGNYTPQIVEELQAAGMHATFFVVGSHAEKYPNAVQQEWAAGMAIGNHTLHHDYLIGAKPVKVRDNIGQTADIIETVTQDPCLWLFRSPYGVLYNKNAVTDEIQHEGYVIVNWDIAGRDWLRPGAAAIAQRVIANLHPGAIILLHDSAPDTENQDRSQTVAALPVILAALKQRGLVSVTLPQLLRDAGYVTIDAPESPHQTDPGTASFQATALTTTLAGSR
jgi:peptidoglycan-N-acetylglucosamine deacetylase